MMHSVKLYLITIFVLLISINTKAQLFATRAISSNIHTLQVNADGNWQQLPIITLNNANNYIRINFDYLADNSPTLRYRLIHCNADWSKSTISEIEYLDGFNNIIIDDYIESVNTTIYYTNYNIEIPNHRQRIKVSGNYVIQVYDTSKPNDILLEACFSVLDPKIQLTGQVSSNTDLDVNKEHQQVSFNIDYPNLPLQDPFADLKILVRQNNRTDNQVSNIKPTYIQTNKLLYVHNKNLIFEAGNEYRRFESVSSRYNGLNMQHTQYLSEHYLATIEPGKIRANAPYVYDKDQNGRYIIRNADSRSDDYDTQADYFMTKFTLKVDEPILEPIFLDGDLTNNLLDQKYQMKYDTLHNEYYTTLLLKQGMYNYQYLTKQGEKYSTSTVEGNHYQTNNEYTIYVYHRPVGTQYDQLIGLLTLSTN